MTFGEKIKTLRKERGMTQKDLAEARWGKSGAEDARELVDGVIGLFAGGKLDDEDKQAVFEAIQEAYFRAKLESESKKAGEPHEQEH